MIVNIKKQFEEQIEKIKDKHDLEEVRILFLGKKGVVTNLLKELKNKSTEDKIILGKDINELKKYIDISIKEKKNNFR